jgi:hypothetical protein
MLRSFLLLLIALFCTRHVLARQDTLFTITDQSKSGYINARGQVIIPPVYYQANDFSEGLAAVRENGLYGFINVQGQYVIKPTFDKAFHFQNGISLVVKEGVSLIIDRSGNPVLPPRYTSLQFIHPQKVVVKTTQGRYGIIDLLSKKLIVDTLYRSLNVYEHGVAIVTQYQPAAKKHRGIKYAVIDSLGTIIVPFGRYVKIGPFVQGYAAIEIKAPWRKGGNTEGAIDYQGNLLYKKPYKDDGSLHGPFNNGLARMLLYQNSKDHEGFINLKGQLVLDDTNYVSAKDFSKGRSFLTTADHKYYLINTAMTILNKEPFEQVEEDPFTNQYAIVKTDKGWGIIDSTANFVVSPQFENIDRVIGNYFFYCINAGDYDSRLFGIATLSMKNICGPVLQQYDQSGFVNGLIKTIQDGKLTYINEQGHIVWQSAPDTSTFLRKLNIDYMTRGYCTAYSTLKNAGEYQSGGWAISRNFPQKNIPALPFKPNSLSIVIDTNRTDTFGLRYFGYPLYIANTSADTMLFNAQDSRLYLKLQAQTNKGEWKDIEYLPSSWCGNSYHTLSLEPGAYWKFVIPQYEGEFNTLIRAELKYVDPANPQKEKILYSHTFKGSINPAQFWSKKTYHPMGIMDPYFD